MNANATNLLVDKAISVKITRKNLWGPHVSSKNNHYQILFDVKFSDETSDDFGTPNRGLHSI